MGSFPERQPSSVKSSGETSEQARESSQRDDLWSLLIVLPTGKVKESESGGGTLSSVPSASPPPTLPSWKEIDVPRPPHSPPVQ
jgi:hypothetical protein